MAVPPLGAPDLLCEGRAYWERWQMSFSPAQGVVKYQGNISGKICELGPLPVLTVSYCGDGDRAGECAHRCHVL